MIAKIAASTTKMACPPQGSLFGLSVAPGKVSDDLCQLAVV